MKRIYVVSLDDEVPLSPEILDNVKLISYLVYDEVLGMEYIECKKILCRDNIKYNELYEKKENGIYTHSYANNSPETGKYEPFMIGDTSFAFTINDGTLTPEEIKSILTTVRTYTNGKCKFNITSMTYQEDSKGKNRLLAIKKILTSEHNKEDKKNKVKIKSLIPLF